MKVEKKITMSLKVKFTLLTIIIMVITSTVLVLAINYDIKKTYSKTFDGVVVEDSTPGSYEPDYNYSVPKKFDGTQMIIPNEKITEREEDADIESLLEEAAMNVYTTSIRAFIIIIVLGAVVAYFAVRHAIRPLEQLNVTIKKVNESNLNKKLDVARTNDEIMELSVSFNKMFAKLNQAFTSQKHFNSRMAHELKTPLAIIQTNIDVLENGTVSIMEYQDTFRVVKKAVAKMDLMIETLLDLVRLENSPLNESVSINEVVYDAVQDLNVLVKEKELLLSLSMDKVKSNIKGNQVLLYRLFYNLIENSIKYNYRYGMITISGHEDKDAIYIMISNTGIGLVQEDLTRIFEPFYRGSKTNQLEIKGLGLGLSFVKSVIDMHAGAIKVKSNKDMGTQFEVRLLKQ